MFHLILSVASLASPSNDTPPSKLHVYVAPATAGLALNTAYSSVHISVGPVKPEAGNGVTVTMADAVAVHPFDPVTVTV